MQSKPVAPAPSPEELAREIDHKVIQFIENPENGHKPFKQYCEDRIAMIAVLLRSRMERAERPLVLGQYHFCPECGSAATYQTPDGTLWDGMAHHWRLDIKTSPNIDITPGGKGDCVGCGKRTEYCCPFCKIKRGQIHWVCESPECREKHEGIGCARTPLPSAPDTEEP